MTKLGTFLARLGGANVEVLDKARKQGQVGPSKEKARYIALGLILIATASLAVLSMTFAMIDGLKLSIASALLMGVGWGVIILIIDRALIINMRVKGGKWSLLGMVAPRLLMAILLSAVIATPLTLRIFDSEVEAEMVKMNAEKANENITIITGGDLQEELDRVKAEIAAYEAILAGRFEATSPLLEQAEAEFAAAEADVKEKQAAYDQASLEWRCEEFGELCPGTNASGYRGCGPRCQVAKEQLARAAAELATAQAVLDAKRAALLTAQEDAKASTEERLKEAQAEANAVLPGLRQQRDELQGALAGFIDAGNETALNDTGLLARLVALERLGQNNVWARLAHLLVAGLLFMIELLPVSIKTLTLLGPPTLYDTVDELDSKQVVEDVSVHRNTHRRRRKAIDDDMFDREVKIARQVNDEVEKVVRKIAIKRVQDWGREAEELADRFAQQSQQPDGDPRGDPDGGAASGHVPRQPGPNTGPGGGDRSPIDVKDRLRERVRARLNLPPRMPTS